ncbi:MAG TPA: hypothetical protein DC017_11765 [Candidatus Wallbacteria bacterium]|jgi:predicted HTH domain antitoxin|nr:hypothetical protein [Candidatus Wallbacteria bacterium]
MAQKILKISIPSDLFLALNKSEDELKNDLILYTAIQFYLNHKLTLGKAAKLAGISKIKFEDILSKNKIPISNLKFNDIENDIQKLSVL